MSKVGAGIGKNLVLGTSVLGVGVGRAQNKEDRDIDFPLGSWGKLTTGPWVMHSSIMCVVYSVIFAPSENGLQTSKR